MTKSIVIVFSLSFGRERADTTQKEGYVDVASQIIERELEDVRNGVAKLKEELAQHAEWWASLTADQKEAVITEILTTHESVGRYLLAQLGHLSKWNSLFEAAFTLGSSPHPLIDQRVLDHVTGCHDCKFVVYRDFRSVQTFFNSPVRSEEAEALLNELLGTD